ncbi:MAG: MBL fold metallo-hydrolase [Myxococcota bacterium]
MRAPFPGIGGSPGTRLALLAVFSAKGLAGCASAPTRSEAEPAPPMAEESETGLAIASRPEEPAREARVERMVVRSARDIPAAIPDPGAFRIHLIDLAMGLSVLIEGADFVLLYDGGSADDRRRIRGNENHNRLLAYLGSAIGVSSDGSCVPSSLRGSPTRQGRAIDHLILSHPHQDHTNLLDEAVRCYPVRNVWDVGVVSHSLFYERFVASVASRADTRYRTAVAPPEDRRLRIRGRTLHVDEAFRWEQFQSGTEVELGASARLRVLHADPERYDDFNRNSLVLRLDLGSVSVLLTGDAETGGVEDVLLAEHTDAIDVDVLVVGDHGGRRSNAPAFLHAVSPTWALLGAGPHRYGRITYPHPRTVEAVLAALAEAPHSLPAQQRLLRTDAHDDRCPESDPVGGPGGGAGGCDNYILEITSAEPEPTR